MSSLLHAKRALERRTPGFSVVFDIDIDYPSDSVVGVSLRDAEGTTELARGADHLCALDASMDVLDAWDRAEALECAGDHARMVERNE